MLRPSLGGGDNREGRRSLIDLLRFEAEKATGPYPRPERSVAREFLGQRGSPYRRGHEKGGDRSLPGGGGGPRRRRASLTALRERSLKTGSAEDQEVRRKRHGRLPSRTSGGGGASHFERKGVREEEQPPSITIMRKGRPGGRHGGVRRRRGRTAREREPDGVSGAEGTRRSPRRENREYEGNAAAAAKRAKGQK